MMSGIYAIEKIETGQIYIGKGKNVIKAMNRTHKGCTYIYNALQKYGKDAFCRYPIEYCEIEKLAKREQYYIKLWNTKVPNGYNLTDGGEGSLGWILSPETIEKMSKAQKGHFVSLETREKSRISHTNPPLQTREKMSKSAKEKPSVSLKTREKLRIASTNPSPEIIEKRKKALLGKKHLGASSSFQGVYKTSGGKWGVRVNILGETKHVGTYKTELEAAKACDIYVIKNNLSYPLNFPDI